MGEQTEEHGVQELESQKEMLQQAVDRLSLRVQQLQSEQQLLQSAISERQVQMAALLQTKKEGSGQERSNIGETL